MGHESTWPRWCEASRIRQGREREEWRLAKPLHHFSISRILPPFFDSQNPSTIFRLAESFHHSSIRKTLPPFFD
jgi:hypothetical protein